MATACWCGGALVPFSDDYLECACGTLRRSAMPSADITHVTDEERDLYGRNYWFARQAALGLPDLERRADEDLHTRSLKWLRIVAAYAAPPGRVLEIGAAHGGFLSLLSLCGFDVTGTELSPWVVDYARRRSGVRMLLGPIEELRLEKKSFDLILLFDVVEHLHDPLTTLTRCAELLTDDGLVIVQTPRRPPNATAAELASTRFRDMLIAEHLHLLSETAACTLLERSGLPHAAAEPPVFDTDMILVAGKKPPRRFGSPPSAPGAASRIIETLLSLDTALVRQQQETATRIAALEARYQAADRDRLERLRQIEELTALYQQADRDRIERQEQVIALEALYRGADRDRVERQRHIGELDAWYREADRDRIERQRQIEELDLRYREADHDRIARQRQIDELHQRYREADEDRAARILQIDELTQRYREVERQLDSVTASYRQADRDRIERLEKIGELLALYKQADDDRTSRFRAIHELEARLRKVDEDLISQLRATGQLEAERAEMRERHERLRAVADDHRNSRIYKALVRLGRWRGYDARLRAALHATAIGEPVQFEQTWTIPNTSVPCGLGAIAVDVTAILPGGENGGAKVAATELIGGMAQVSPGREFLLLTSPATHHELEALDAANVRRRPITAEPTALSALLEEEPVALLFSPMTASRFDDPRVPVVCLVHDLQYLTYPEFFDEAERRDRTRAFSRVVSSADHVVTPSQYVRSTVLQHSRLPESQVTVIPHGFGARRFADATSLRQEETLSRYGLIPGRYFVYPANFWSHKNHVLLLIAFGKLCRKRPDLGVQLVLTGADRPHHRDVPDYVARMGLADRIVFPGYVPEAELGALMGGALALIFPSLYEGYGMPIVEAFAAGCPVACSNVTSLPEVAGDAAEYFDPRKPDEIAAVLERLATCPTLVADLRRRGHERLREVESWDDTARRYLDIIETAMSRPRRVHTDQLGGVFTDGWTTSSIVVAHLGGAAELRLQLENAQPGNVTLEAPGVEPITLEPQQALALRCILPPAPGHIVIHVRPTFRPADAGQSVDTRRLGVRVRQCHLHRSGAGPVDLFAAMANA